MALDVDSRARLRVALEAQATERSRRFWTGYVRGSPPFLGVPMRGVRAVVADWWRNERLDAVPRAQQLEAALALFEGEHAEERLAGILVLAEHLGPSLVVDDLPAFARLFEKRLLSDWNLTDWFCVKVLAPMIRQDPKPPTVARAVAAWRESEPLWQRRAACVAFVPLAPEGGARIGALPDLVEVACEALVADPERFAQTGVGWALRELARAEPERVRAFAERHLERLSMEAVRSLGKGLPEDVAERLVVRKKMART